MTRYLTVVLLLAACGDDTTSVDAGDPADAAPLDASSDGSGDADRDGAILDADYPLDSGPLPDGIPVPLRSVIEDDAPERIVITFDRVVGVSNDAGFTIRGADVTVTGVSARGPELTLRLSEQVHYLQNAITWSYDDSVGGVHNLRALRLIYVDNRVAEPALAGTEYFVSPTGSSDNDGLSESSPWTIAHAVSQVGPGDKVWVRAGVYDNPQLELETDGTADARIVFEGYRTSTDGVPDPITSISYEPTPGGELDGDLLPLFRGQGNQGVAFLIRGQSFLTFRNLAFTHYRMAFLGNFHPLGELGDEARAVRYCLFERILGTNFGEGGGGGEDGALIELGLATYNEYNTIRQSIAQDSSMVAFYLGGRGDNLSDCVSYGLRDDDVARESQDYYFALVGRENVALRNRAHRVIATEHGGHGFALRGEAPTMTEYNLLQDNEVINISGAYELRNETSAYNVVRNCVASVDGVVNGESTGGLQFSGGAHHNLIEGFSGRGMSAAIRFARGRESDVNSCGHDNVVRNSEFYGMPEFEGTNGYSHKHAVHVDSGQADAGFTNNRFIGCTFHDFSYFLRFTSSGAGTIDPSGNEFVGSSMSLGLYFKHPETPDELGVAFQSCNFYEADSQDGGFGPLVGMNGNISVDPAYVDEGSFNFALSEGSGLIDQGIDHDDLLFDITGAERPQGGANDIGAHER